MAHEDLLGGAPLVPAGTSNMREAVDAGIARADGQEVDPKELTDVKKLMAEYQAARDFDKPVRAQYVRDRKYAAGLSDLNWASDANIVGAIIDILVSYLYAKDPRFEARPAKRVQEPADLAMVPPINPAMLPGAPLPGAAPAPMPGDPAALAPPLPSPMGAAPGLPTPPAGGMDAPGQAPALPALPGAPVPGMPPVAPPQPQAKLDSQAFADTLTLVINRLWKDARFKKTARRFVRSALSVGPGWFKALAFSETRPDPQMASQMRDFRASLEQLQGLQKQLSYDGFDSPEERDAKVAELEQTIAGMGPKLEKVVRQGMSTDFVPAEQMTIWLDVAFTEDYLNSGALAEDIFVPRTQLCERFPRLSEDDIKTAVSYYQRKSDSTTQSQSNAENDSSTEGQYTKDSTGNTSAGDTRQGDHVKVIEVWDRRVGLIKTMVDGIKKWAVEPYPPPQTTTRFYPYFRLALFEVDGQRHPQSLSWRLHKLQDEYSAARSNQRLTRERSVPGIIFNRGQLSDEEVRKVTGAVHQEYVGINSTDPNMPAEKLFAQKMNGTYDPRIFDTTPIVADMAKVSGVQEPQQGAANPEITATQAQIEQSGFRSRTGTDRDTLEEVLKDFAVYCTECAIQSITADYAHRIAGPAAFWPEGMDVQDILTLVEVDIEAGSTGKPNADASREAWATLLPLVKDTLLQVRQFDVTDPPLADALRNILRETIRRLDDRINLDQFIPPASNPPLMPQMAAPGPEKPGTPAKPSNTPPGPPMMQ
jgi:hypothetical protein